MMRTRPPMVVREGPRAVAAARRHRAVVLVAARRAMNHGPINGAVVAASAGMGRGDEHSEDRERDEYPHDRLLSE